MKTGLRSHCESNGSEHRVKSFVDSYGFSLNCLASQRRKLDLGRGRPPEQKSRHGKRLPFHTLAVACLLSAVLLISSWEELNLNT